MSASFWDKFSQLPQVQNKSQNQIARDLNVAPNTVGAWRRMGVWPDPATFEKIKTWTGKDQRWFLEDKAPEFISVPIYSSKLATSGGTLPVVEQVNGTYQFRRDWYSKLGASASHSGLFIVQDDSMSPSVQFGDVVLTDMSDRTVLDGKIYAICESDTILIKELRRTRRSDMLSIISHNKENYPEYKRRQSDILIVGRVRWSAHKWD
ncbi:MAG: helix-turn-helix transcriptional regulator [Desulfomonilaceae bacterium]